MSRGGGGGGALLDCCSKLCKHVAVNGSRQRQERGSIAANVATFHPALSPMSWLAPAADTPSGTRRVPGPHHRRHPQQTHEILT